MVWDFRARGVERGSTHENNGFKCHPLDLVVHDIPCLERLVWDGGREGLEHAIWRVGGDLGEIEELWEMLARICNARGWLGPEMMGNGVRGKYLCSHGSWWGSYLDAGFNHRHLLIDLEGM